MAKRIILAVGLIIVAIFLGIFFSYQYSMAKSNTTTPGTAVPKENSIEAASSSNRGEMVAAAGENESSAMTEEPASSGYTLRDYNGKVAVFPTGGTTPEMVFDVYTRMLPQADQQRLKDGIYVESYEELIQLVEDYIS